MDQSKRKKHYFMSYTHKDLDIAKKLEEDLEKHDFEICMHEHNIIGGSRRNILINGNIQRSIAVLYLVSPTSRHSLHADPDLEYAKICRKNIIPLWVRGDTEWGRVVAPDLFSTEYFDLRGETYETEIKKLTQILSSLSYSEARFTRYIEKDNGNNWLQKVGNLLIATAAESGILAQNMRDAKSSRTDTFISCSDEDEGYLRNLLIHLKPHIRNDGIKVWNRTNILPGSDCYDEIKRAIQSTKIAVFLISADFFASDFIVDHELSPFLEVAESEGVILLPVILKPCDAFHHSPLARFPAFPLPLAFLKSVEQDLIWSSLAGFLWKTLKGQSD